MLADQVRDPRQRDRSRRRALGARVDLDPIAAERGAVAQARAVEGPGLGAGSLHHVRRLHRAVVAGRPLRANQRRLGPAELAPHLHAPEQLPVALDLPEEVVRGQEHQAPAEVAVAPDDVVDVLGHVLLVPGENDQVVRAPQGIAAADPLEVVIREVVDLLARPLQPRDEAQVPVPEAKGDAEVEVGPAQVDRPGGAADVPAVAPAVAVLVEEVVGLPGVGGEHDRDLVLAERTRPQDERRVADPPVAGGHAQEVEAALGDAGVADLDEAGGAATTTPVEAHCGSDGEAARAQVAHGRMRQVREREELQPDAPRIGCDGQARLSADRVAAVEKAGLDPLHPHDEAARQAIPPRRLVAVDASPPLRPWTARRTR